MESIFAATKARPQTKQELQSVLQELPRRALVALSKTHSVPATLKRESLVPKLVDVLAPQLWPTPECHEEQETKASASTAEAERAALMEAMSNAEKENITVDAATVKKLVAVVKANVAAKATESATDPEVKVTADTTPMADKTKAKPVTTENKNAAANTTTKVALVAKKAVATAKRGTQSPSKLKKATPAKATAMTPSKALDKIHAKQAAKQPTLQEHERAKKERAAMLLLGSKFSAVKKTRSKTKEIATADKEEWTVTKTLSFGVSTPAKKPSAAAKEKASGAVAPKEATSAKKTKAAYKPYAGPVPAYEGDSLFSPKKVQTRPAPMAVSVMKAARVAAPKKSKGEAPPKNATPVKKATPTKKSPVKKSPTKKSPIKTEVAKKSPVNENSTTAASEKKTAVSGSLPKKTTASSKARVTVKAKATVSVSQEAKKDERRTKFAQDAKEKSTAARRGARSAATRSTTNTTNNVASTTSK